MRTHEITAWALQVIEAIENGQPNEDSTVELKAEWPDDFEKTARRLAGHCNAARGEYVLWLIGVDGKSGVKGANHEELANWYPKIKAQFDALPPKLTDVNVPYNDKTIAALLFETDQAPFVVKNPCFNKQGGGAVQFEVPWRESTATRSARHSDLIRVLSPLQKLPRVEIVKAMLQPAQTRQLSGTGWNFTADAYFMLQDQSPVVVPLHRCEAHAEFAGIDTKGPFSSMEFKQQGNQHQNSQLVFNLSGLAHIRASNNGFPFRPKGDESVVVELKLVPDGAPRPITIPITLFPNTRQLVWHYPEDKS